MQNNEDIRELSAKLHRGLELAEQKLLEETAARNGSLCFGAPDGKVVCIPAKEVLKKRKHIASRRSTITG